MAGGLSGKTGGLPNWLLLGGAVVGVAFIYIYRKNKAAAAAAAASTSATPVATGAATTPYGPAYGTGVDPGTLAAILASQGNAANAPGGTTTTIPTTGALTGLGYAPPSGQGYVSSTSGQNFVPLGSWGAALALPPGTTVYYEPAPGVVMPAGTVGGGTSKLNLPPGSNTPLYLPA